MHISVCIHSLGIFLQVHVYEFELVYRQYVYLFTHTHTLRHRDSGDPIGEFDLKVAHWKQLTASD